MSLRYWEPEKRNIGPSTTNWSTAEEGRIWYDKSTHRFCFWDGIATQVVAGTSGGVFSIPASSMIWTDGSTYYRIDRDGTYSSDGSFEDLINDAITNGIGSHIYLASGSYTVGNSINVNQPNVRIWGAGGDTNLIKNAIGGHVINVTRENCSLGYFTINCSSQTSGNAINVSMNSGINTSSFQMVAVRVDDAYGNAVNVTGSSTSNKNIDGRIHHCTFGGTSTSNGIYLHSGSEYWDIFDCLIREHTGTNKAGIVIDANNDEVSFCHIWGNYYDVYVAPTNSVRRLRFIANGVMDNKRHGFFWSGSNSFTNSIINDNVFWNNGRDTTLTFDSLHFSTGSTGWCSQLSINGNAFWAYPDSGTYYTRYAIFDSGSRLTGSIIMGNVTDDYVSPSILHINETWNIVEHNKSI